MRLTCTADELAERLQSAGDVVGEPNHALHDPPVAECAFCNPVEPNHALHDPPVAECAFCNPDGV